MSNLRSQYRWIIWFCALGFLFFASEFLVSFNYFPEHLTEHNFFDVSQRHYQKVLGGHLSQERSSVNAHAMLGVVLLITGLFQLSEKFRIRHRKLHQILGIVYMAVGLISVTIGIVISEHSIGGPVTRAAFFTFAAYWFVTAVQSIRSMLVKKYKLHRRWSVRNYFAVLATGFIRPWLFVVDLIFPNQPPEILFPISCWTSVVLALVLSQIYIEWSEGQPKTAGQKV